MNNIFEKIVSGVVLFGIIGVAEAADLSRLVSDPDYLISEVRKAEEKLINVTAEVEIWVEERANETDAWQKSPLLTLSTRVWMDGIPKGKICVEVKGEKFMWYKDDGNVMMERDYSLSFDGKQGMELNSRELRDGKEFSVKPSGRIWSDRPKQLYSGNLIFASGRGVTMNHFFTRDSYDLFGNSFSGLLTMSVTAQRVGELGYEISTENYEGVECIKIRTPSSVKRVTEIWWLDPNRGFLLVGHKETNTKRDGTEWIIAELNVTAVVEAASGVWLPTEATILSGPSDATGQKYRKCFYKAKNVRANVTDLDEKSYRISFPEGTKIENVSSN